MFETILELCTEVGEEAWSEAASNAARGNPVAAALFEPLSPQEQAAVSVGSLVNSTIVGCASCS